MRKLSFRALVVAAVVSVSFMGCGGTPQCSLDGGTPMCECTPGDARECVSAAGHAGLEACGMDGTWTTCAEFMDGTVTPSDAVVTDTGLFETGTNQE